MAVAQRRIPESRPRPGPSGQDGTPVAEQKSDRRAIPPEIYFTVPEIGIETLPLFAPYV